ncbi:hypothetical protein Goari_022559 [Gossypium aridum]|uniref:DUF4283 domain-containing protein n=1 Tax=Gossypium aridum TaxID=34290 RepID=A0A7J8YQP1_GOSAI|nr:hypothetical protein [Gossypium aridum]
MERGIADLSIEDGEEEAFPVPDGVEPQNSVYNLCLVGRFLTSSVVHFPAMRNMMANLWHPLEGVQISNLGEKYFLFKFFNELNISQVITGVPWTFNNHILIMHILQDNEDPMSISLVYSDFWV